MRTEQTVPKINSMRPSGALSTQPEKENAAPKKTIVTAARKKFSIQNCTRFFGAGKLYSLLNANWNRNMVGAAFVLVIFP
jgi:hypothetical protein